MSKYKKAFEEIDTLIDDYLETEEISKYSLKENSSTIYLDFTEGEIYQEYSGKKILNEGIFAYMEKAYSYAKMGSFLKTEIIFPEEMTSTEKSSIQKKMKMHYAIELKETNLAIFRTNLKGTISLIIGAILFFIFGLLEWYKVNFIFQGIIEIFSWVFIWEACDSFFFTNSANRLKRIRFFNLYRSLQDF